MQELHRLTSWAAPNGWNYWGPPYAYIDASSGHPDMLLESTLCPPSLRVTVVVLVNCPRESQYFPDMSVTQSAVLAVAWVKHKTRVFTPSGQLPKNPGLLPASKHLVRC